MTLAPPPSGELVRGWADIPLNRQGETLAERLAKDLKGSNIAFLITSDLDRAVETAEIIEKIAKIPILEKTKALRTWGLGELEGMPLEGAKEILRYYSLKAPNDKPKGGESRNQFKQRVLRKTQQIMKIGVPVGMVTHHWPQEVISRWVQGGAKEDLAIDFRGLFEEKQDPPGTIIDLIERAGHHWIDKKVNPAKYKEYGAGPVIIRHATTAWNAKGRG